MKNRNIIDSFKCAIRGLISVFKTEKNCWFYLANIIAFGIVNYFIGATQLNWILYFVSFVGAYASECINTAIERLCDFVTEEKHEKIRLVKDAAAGSVLCWGLLFYINELFIIGSYL